MTILELRILRRCLDTLSSCTLVPLTFFDSKYEIQEEFLASKRFCSGFHCFFDKNSPCREMLHFSMDMAMELGSPYFFFCGSGLVMIAMPVILHEVKEGCVLAGPVSMGEVDLDIIESIIAMNDATPDIVKTVVESIPTINNYSTDRVQQFSDLLYMSVSGCFQNWDEYTSQYDKYNEQIRAGNKIGKNKKLQGNNRKGEEDTSLMEKLKKSIMTKNKDEALALMETIIERIFVETSGNLDLIKLRVIHVYALMFEMAQKRGVINKKILTYKGSFLMKITELTTLSEVRKIMDKEVEYYVDELFVHVQQGHSPLIEKAVQYINDNYMEKVSLRDLSEHLHINESYLSKLFKKEFSQCFTEYLNEVRINNSIILMRDASKNLLEISNSVGFNNQSYFTKIFIKIKGVSPKHFRQELLKGEKEE